MTEKEISRLYLNKLFYLRQMGDEKVCRNESKESDTNFTDFPLFFVLKWVIL